MLVKSLLATYRSANSCFKQQSKKAPQGAFLLIKQYKYYCSQELMRHPPRRPRTPFIKEKTNGTSTKNSKISNS
jgi:hypothetical protein